MSFVANLFTQVRPHHAAPIPRQTRASIDDDMFQIEAAGLGLGDSVAEQRRKEEQERKEEKRKAKEAKEAEKIRQKRLEEERRKKATQPKTKRKPFNYEEVGLGQWPSSFSCSFLLYPGETPNPHCHRERLHGFQ